MLALEREDQYIVHQASSDMNLTKTRLWNSIDLALASTSITGQVFWSRGYPALHSFHG